MGLLDKAKKALGSLVSKKPAPIPREQIERYEEICCEVIIQLLRRQPKEGGLLPAEGRFLEALPVYFADCIGRYGAEQMQDGEVEHGYWRCMKEFWKEWDPLFRQIAEVRQIDTERMDGWCLLWQEDLLILKLFCDREHFTGARPGTLEDWYQRESWALDLRNRLIRILEQEGLTEISLPDNKAA